MMVRYELKKIFGSAGSKIALLLYIGTVVLSCWLAATGALNTEVKWINEKGEREYGISAVRKLRDAQNEWEGELDEEKLSAVIKELQRINASPEAQSLDSTQREIAYGWMQGIMPIRDVMNFAYAPDFKSYDYYTADSVRSSAAGDFYINRTKLLKDYLYRGDGTRLFTDAEKDYLIRKYEELNTPFYFDYFVGWHQLLENSGYISTLGILILNFLLAGIFSNEFKWKSDPIYFSSLHGRNKATASKIKAGFLLVTVMYWSAIGIYSLFTLYYFGFEGANCPIQIQWEQWKTCYNLTMLEAWILTSICGYIGNLFLAFVTMCVSCKTKSTVIAVSVPFIIYLVPAFLEGISDWLDMILMFTPTRLLEFYANIRTFEFTTFFGKVHRALDLCIPLYICLTVLLIPVMYREYKTKQVL